MNSQSKDIRDFLIGQGLDGDIIFIGDEPADPDACLTIYNTPSMLPPNPGWALDNCAIQVRSRAIDYETAYSNLADVKQVLLGVRPFTQDDTLYVGVWATSDIINIGRDEKSRTLFVMNFKIVREPNTANAGSRYPLR